MTNLNYVKIKTGTYRKNEIVDTVFPILKPLNVGKKGAFITVDGSEVMGDKFASRHGQKGVIGHMKTLLKTWSM